jgi:2-polyprenyl-3-methyl-5-hydroxy-6-metoxy-1,4-benzoquinol methylase
VCEKCLCVEHKKKDEYFTEQILPAKIMQMILPKKAYRRLFKFQDADDNKNIYDAESNESIILEKWKASETDQIEDQLKLISFSPKKKKILDISGGPGIVGKKLKQDKAFVHVSEFSQDTVQMMRKKFNLIAKKFDYNSDNIKDIFPSKYDLIMIRSSIIFCKNLDKLIKDCSFLLKKNGVLMLETILPSLGEIFWWQQLEYKFPFIWSEKQINKVLNKNKLTKILSYKEHGNYLWVKLRSHRSLARKAFILLVELPLVYFYFLLTLINRNAVPISRDLKHRMLTQFWKKTKYKKQCKYACLYQGKENKSKTFGYVYNGYLKKVKFK